MLNAQIQIQQPPQIQLRSEGRGGSDEAGGGGGATFYITLLGKFWENGQFFSNVIKVQPLKFQSRNAWSEEDVSSLSHL